MKVQIENDLDDLSHAAARLLIEIARRANQSRGSFSIVLSGGSTPRYLYSLLASPKYAHAIDWTAANIFIGDERNVLPEAPESNYRMAKEILLEPLGIDLDRVVRFRTELGDVELVAADYERELAARLGPGGRFDVVLLGLGSDAHTASLFPRTAALRETERLAVANWVAGLNDHRLTITFPAINRSANVMFLVSGAEKSGAVAEIIEGESRPDDLPAQRVDPNDGELYWLLDELAAAKLKNR